MGFFGGGRQLVAGWTNGVCVWTPESGARVDFPIPTNLARVQGISSKT